MLTRLAVLCIVVAVGVIGDHHLMMDEAKGLDKAIAFFAMNGFHGPVSLYLNRTTLHVDMRKLNYSYPKPLAIDVHRLSFTVGMSGSPCESIGDHYNPTNNPMLALGDLSGSPGGRLLNATTRRFAIETNLTFTGHHSIIGRSVAFHEEGNETAVACANIVHANMLTDKPSCGSMSTDNDQDTLEAVFNGMIAGRITFRSLKSFGMGVSNSTTILSRLFYTNGNNASRNHLWHAHNNSVGDNGDCINLGAISQDFTSGSGGHAPHLLTIGDGDGDEDSREVHNLLQAAPFGNLIGKSLAIHRPSDLKIIACANIAKVHPRSFVAKFSDNSEISISQKDRYSSSEVNTNLKSRASKVNINKFKAGQMSGGCGDAKVGGVFNPFNKMGSDMMKPERSPTGDIGGKFGRMMQGQDCDNSLSLFGSNSVGRRSVSITVGGQVWCANLTEKLATGEKMMRAKAMFNMSGSVRGMMSIEQVVRSDGTMGITTISSDGLMNMDGASMKHNYHVHIGRKGYQNTSAACGSAYAGGHYNPFNVSVTSDSKYSTDCTSDNPLRCEVGDTSKKTGTIDLDTKPLIGQDSFMPLMGGQSVMGRSFVIHSTNQGAPRIACANIIPMSAYDVQIGVKTSRLSGGFSAATFNQRVKDSSSMAKDVDVLYTTMNTDAATGCTYINAAIDGPNAQTVSEQLSRADLGTEYSQMASECTQGVSFASQLSSASTVSHVASLILLACAAVLLL
eukprot:scpid17636/ scgid34445/ 